MPRSFLGSIMRRTFTCFLKCYHVQDSFTNYLFWRFQLTDRWIWRQAHLLSHAYHMHAFQLKFPNSAVSTSRLLEMEEDSPSFTCSSHASCLSLYASKLWFTPYLNGPEASMRHAESLDWFPAPVPTYSESAKLMLHGHGKNVV